MPRLVPAHGPRGGADCPRAEARLYAALERGLGDDWLVVHGAHWLAPSRPGEPLRDGQAAFVLAHPDHGILVLEVVGGGVRYEPSGDRWSRTDLAGRAEPLSDPFRGAETALETLLACLALHPGATPSRPPCGWGVVLPDIPVPARGLAPHAPADVTLDQRGAERLTQAVPELLERWQRRRPAQGNASSRWWWRALEDLFLAPREAKVLLRHRIADEQKQMVALSPQQLSVLDLLTRVRRQAVYGPAGTGKTLLAVHEARLLARRGLRVLLTCYNKSLGHHLRDALSSEPNVKALHFHELCYDAADLRARGVEVPEDGAARQRFFDHDLAEHLLAAAREQGPQFDALVVDEAQDFPESWWRALDALLVDPQRAIRFVFFDDAQRLRDDGAPVEGADQALTLTTNWRNTQAIHEHLIGVEPQLQLARCVAPAGLPVELEPLRPTATRALRRVLHRICGDGGVRPDDVVLLTGRAPNRSQFHGIAAEIAPFRLTTGDEPGAIRLRGVKAFKGMEAPVVVLTELEHYPAELARRLHYVGGSRAMNHLVVLDDAKVPLTLPGTLPGTLPPGPPTGLEAA